VSNNPRPVSLLLAHFNALASSPERPLRPLPVLAVDEVQSFPLTPRSRARAPPLRNAPARGPSEGQERCPGAMPASPAARRRSPANPATTPLACVPSHWIADPRR
jgi:hypothetical protein